MTHETWRRGHIVIDGTERQYLEQMSMLCELDDLDEYDIQWSCMYADLCIEVLLAGAPN